MLEKHNIDLFISESDGFLIDWYSYTITYIAYLLYD